MAYTRQLSTQAAREILARVKAGEWTQTEAAKRNGVSRPAIHKLINGITHKDVMAWFDPSSCAPTYRHPPVSNLCPGCRHGLHIAVGSRGETIAYCPSCG